MEGNRAGKTDYGKTNGGLNAGTYCEYIYGLHGPESNFLDLCFSLGNLQDYFVKMEA